MRGLRGHCSAALARRGPDSWVCRPGPTSASCSSLPGYLWGGKRSLFTGNAAQGVCGAVGKACAVTRMLIAGNPYFAMVLTCRPFLFSKSWEVCVCSHAVSVVMCTSWHWLDHEVTFGLGVLLWQFHLVSSHLVSIAWVYSHEFRIVCVYFHEVIIAWMYSREVGIGWVYFQEVSSGWLGVLS